MRRVPAGSAVVAEKRVNVYTPRGGGSMEIALIIVGGVVLITVLPMLIQNRQKKGLKADPALNDTVAELERKVASLEERLTVRDERINQLETTVSFVNRLLDDKSPKA
jgi:uncharacterized coiled-coil protein SlyX